MDATDTETTLPRRPSYHWTPALQREFLEHLAATGSVQVAAMHVSMSPSAAYQLRHRPDGAAFKLGWAAAVLIASHAAVEELGLSDDLALVGLAKSRLRGVGDARRESGERLFLAGARQPVPLPEEAPETHLVAHLRDEAHRFAIGYHRQVRGKLTSQLDGIPGVGPSRRRSLLRRFGSLTGVREASLDDLTSVPGMPRAVAERVYRKLRE